MLTQSDTGIYEQAAITNTNSGGVTSGMSMTTTGCFGGTSSINYYEPFTYWHSYPVYVCTDKTKKAIDVLKALQAEKLLKCDSVPRFIELVDKIAGLL